RVAGGGGAGERVEGGAGRAVGGAGRGGQRVRRPVRGDRGVPGRAPGIPERRPRRHGRCGEWRLRGGRPRPDPRRALMYQVPIIAFPNHLHQTNYPHSASPSGPLTGGKPGGSMSALTEADTRAKLIDPAIHARGGSEDLIRREESAGAVEIVAGKARRRSRGRMDYTLRIRVNPATQPVAVALLEAKKESLPPDHGLDQAKAYARASQHNV